jgi:hypothetical protein
MAIQGSNSFHLFLWSLLCVLLAHGIREARDAVSLLSLAVNIYSLGFLLFSMYEICYTLHGFERFFFACNRDRTCIILFSAHERGKKQRKLKGFRYGRTGGRGTFGKRFGRGTFGKRFGRLDCFND